MSDQEEKVDAQKTTDASKRSDAFETITIPFSTEEPVESSQSEELHNLEQEPSSQGSETRVGLQSEGTYVSLEEDHEEASVGEVVSPIQESDTSASYDKQYVTSSYNVMPPSQPPPDNQLAFPDTIKSKKVSLQSSRQELSATVKVVLLPVAQEITMPFRVNAMFKHLKDYFSHWLNIPSKVLQITSLGVILKDNETLLQHEVKPQDVVQVEISSKDPDLYKVRRIDELSSGSVIITVRVQTGIDESQYVAVEIVKSDFHKPFLGGYRHKITGIEYHNAGTQTVPKKIIEKGGTFCRDTQTVYEKRKFQQTRNTTSTQMTKIGVYVSNMTDKLVTPGRYFTAAEYHAQRLQAVIVLQTYYRQWHARTVVQELKRQKKVRLEWEFQEEQKKIREKEDWMKRDYYRRHNPQNEEDFELLYNALELWRQEESERINQFFTGAEKKAALYELLEKETQIIASIGRHKYIAKQKNQEASVEAFLDKCSAPKLWTTPSGQMVEVDTQFTIRARELQSIYKCIILNNISQDERLEVLLTLKHTVKEHDCKLTQEILELIDREVDLMMRGVKYQNLEGLRKRITTLFLHYIKTPLFNPEVTRHLKVPQDPLKFYKKIYFCHSCQLYLPSTEFSVSCTSQRIYRCRQCSDLDNETRKRESFLKYRCLLQRLYFSEVDYDDNSKIAYLVKLQDIQYLVENIWAAQSAFSACDDLSDLVLVRWDKSRQWSPWNCILLTKSEGFVHLKLESVEEAYEPSFIHKVKHKHILAKNYFSQIPALASYILDDEEMDAIRMKYCPGTS